MEMTRRRVIALAAAGLTPLLSLVQKAKADEKRHALYGTWHVRCRNKHVDIVTEGSSLTKNYYDQFHKFLTTPGQGYPHIVKKLNEKIAKKD